MVEQAKQRTREAMNPLTEFFEECCDFGEEHWCSRRALREHYLEWAKRNGVRRPIGARELCQRLRRNDCRDEDGYEGGRDVEGWRGVAPSSPSL